MFHQRTTPAPAPLYLATYLRRDTEECHRIFVDAIMDCVHALTTNQSTDTCTLAANHTGTWAMHYAHGTGLTVMMRNAGPDGWVVRCEHRDTLVGWGMDVLPMDALRTALKGVIDIDAHRVR